MRNVQNALQKSSSSYVSSENKLIKINNIDGLRADIKVTKQNIPLRSTLVFFQKDDGIYMLQLGCREELFERIKEEQERAINSFK